MKIPAGILTNKKTGRFHPVFFRADPSDGCFGEDKRRYRAFSYHPEGFSAMTEAEDWLSKQDTVRDMGVGSRWEWRGDMGPAITYWYRQSEIEAPLTTSDEVLELKPQLA